MLERPLNHLRPGDVIEWRGDKTGVHRLWWVHGIHIGGMTQESVICLEAVDKTPAWDEIDLPLMWVPEVLTRTCRIAGHADSRDEAAIKFRGRP